MEHVNHPKHYNQHPAGIECIDIIRHYSCDIANAIKYLWRAGLKVELGKEDAEKEIEDLKKALWYIEDYKTMCHTKGCQHRQLGCAPSVVLLMLTGYGIDDVKKGYEKHVAAAIEGLLKVGIISENTAYAVEDWEYWLDIATKNIQRRILFINEELLNKEIEETKTVLNGGLVDGEDYVSKPGCVRETEPEKYDPLNMVVAWGRVYSLTDEIRKKTNGALYGPCENCDLWSECHEWQGVPTPMLTESPCHYLCARLHQAETNEYYKEVGVARYSPRFGTIEVVDEHKEMELEMKESEDELKQFEEELRNIK